MRQAVQELMRARDDGAADGVERLSWGAVLTTPSLPLIWDLNHVRVEDPELPPEVAVAEAERRGLPKVLWEHPPAGGPPRGRPQRVSVLPHVEAPDRAEPGAEVRELGPRERDEIIRRVLLDDEDRAWFAEDMLAAHRRWHRAQETVALGVTGPDGALAGQAWIHRHGGIAQIEDVNVLSSARGRGLGRALIAGALQRRRPHERMFIMADADDWPQKLYAKLGFREAWSRAAAYLAPGRADA